VRRSALLLAALLLAAALLAGCQSGSPAMTATPRPSPPVIYAAIGASETSGAGTEDPVRESFPQRLLQRLGPSAVLYNFGLPSETTAAALQDELPPAIRVQPTLATVWLNVDDLIGGAPVTEYEVRLDQLVAALRRAAARVLVANTPHLDRLPAYTACRPEPPLGSPKCPLGAVTLPPPDQVEALVQAYNEAIARVAAREGATLVDLHAAGEVPVQHPEYVGRDGFHPSAAGAAAIADAFAAALGRRPESVSKTGHLAR
jgi:lysophospholipase L1-like esterase